MTPRSSFAGVLLVVALGLSLAGAGRLASEPTADAIRYRSNLARWNESSEQERETLRESWRALQARPASQRALTETRYAVLCRLRQRVERAGAAEASPDRLAEELTWELSALTRQAQREVPEAPADISLADAVQLLFRQRVEALLDHLQARGQLAADERARLLALPPDTLADEGLRLLKADRLALLPADSAAELADADPRDVIDRVDEMHRQQGFLGRAGALWPLSVEERDFLASLPTSEQVHESLRKMRVPAIRECLVDHPLTTEQVDDLLAQPWNELERSLDHLLASR